MLHVLGSHVYRCFFFRMPSWLHGRTVVAWRSGCSADAPCPPTARLWACPTRNTNTLPPPSTVCHSECPTLMFGGKPHGHVPPDTNGKRRLSATLLASIRSPLSIGFTRDRLVQTGNLLTGRGSSIADASVLANEISGLLWNEQLHQWYRFVFFLFPFKDICLWGLQLKTLIAVCV